MIEVGIGGPSLIAAIRKWLPGVVTRISGRTGPCELP